MARKESELLLCALRTRDGLWQAKPGMHTFKAVAEGRFRNVHYSPFCLRAHQENK